MSFGRPYSDDGLTFVKQAYFEQLHLAVLSALEEYKKNYKVSSDVFNFSLFGKWRFSDFARGWHFNRAKDAPDPQELSVDQSYAGSALEATIKHMSFDKDFQAIANIVDKIKQLKMSENLSDWNNSINYITTKAMTNPILKGRFLVMKTLFFSEHESSVSDIIESACFSYSETMGLGVFPFNAAVQKDARSLAKEQASVKSSSHSILSCFNFSSAPQYREVSSVDVVSDSESYVEDSIAGHAEKIFASYFKMRGMKGAWSADMKIDKMPERFKAQHAAAKEVLTLLGKVRAQVSAIAIIARMAELMYDATQRQGFGYFVPFKPSQFAETLKSVAVALVNSLSSDEQFDDKWRQVRRELGQRYALKFGVIETEVKAFKTHKAEMGWRPMQTHHVAFHKSAIKQAKASALQQLGVNRCFDLISEAITADKSSGLGVHCGDSSTHSRSNLGTPKPSSAGGSSSHTLRNLGSPRNSVG